MRITTTKGPHNRQDKIAVINDISGFGRCSIAVSLPLISHMRIQCCPVPTSIFSNHTGFPDFYFDDYTQQMPLYIQQWKQLNLYFQGILTGFLGSLEQIDLVRNFIRDFKDEDTVVIIDPVMGDNGKAYSTYTESMCAAMKELAKLADILTPNLTEACILTDTPYTPEKFRKKDYETIVHKLQELGPGKIVITGIRMGEFIGNVVYEEGQEVTIIRQKRAGSERSGTGDVFSSIIAADAVHEIDFVKSVKKASRFVKECILITEEFGIPGTDGVCFEEVLHKLK